MHCTGLSTTLGLAFKRLRLEHFQRRTIAIETGIQNVQVASGIIVLSDFSIIEEGQVILHPFLYLVGQVRHCRLGVPNFINGGPNQTLQINADYSNPQKTK